LTGPSPVDRARTGPKHHLLCDATGAPLAVSLAGGNRNDVTQLLPLVDGVEPVAGRRGRPRRRPERLLADRAYDHDKYRRERWVVERTFAWLHGFRRPRIRYERLPELHQAFLDLGCAVICLRMLGWP
jgi:transposase